MNDSRVRSGVIGAVFLFCAMVRLEWISATGSGVFQFRYFARLHFAGAKCGKCIGALPRTPKKSIVSVTGGIERLRIAVLCNAILQIEFNTSLWNYFLRS